MRVVGLTAQDLFVAGVRCHRGQVLDGCCDGLAAGERLTTERSGYRHVLGDDLRESVCVRAAVHAVDEGLNGLAVLSEHGHGCSVMFWREG